MPHSLTRRQALQNARFLEALSQTGKWAGADVPQTSAALPGEGRPAHRLAARSLGVHRSTYTKRRANAPPSPRTGTPPSPPLGISPESPACHRHVTQAGHKHVRNHGPARTQHHQARRRPVPAGPAVSGHMLRVEEDPPFEDQLAVRDLVMNPAHYKVRRAGRLIALTQTEFRLLRYLMMNPGRVFSRGQLLRAVWPHRRDIEAQTINVHVRRLRAALNMHGGKDLIRTVRGIGYALDDED